MKKVLLCRERGGRHGFTLIELLVVIGIMAILMAFIIPAYSKFKEHAVRLQTKDTAKALELALRAYYQEYNRWPSIVDSDNDFTMEGDIVYILRGDVDKAVNDADNPKHICFFEFDDSGGGAPVIRDPFSYNNPTVRGEPYMFRVDHDFDNVINHYGQKVYRPVIVWSWGGNTEGTEMSKALSDEAVRSWD